jgi:fibronectin-binding autotransporter adhesin
MKSLRSRPAFFSGRATAATLLALAAFSGQSYAQFSIGGSFIGRGNDQTLAIDDLAGVIPQRDWNNLGSPFKFNDNGNGPFTSTPLLLDNGVLGTSGTSAVTVTVDANDSWSSDGPTSTPNDKLMKGVIKANSGEARTGTVTFNNLKPKFLYDVVAYTATNGGGSNSNWSLTGLNPYQTFFITEENSFDGTFTRGISTDSAVRTAETDYVRWENVLASAANTLNLSFVWVNGTDGTGMAGFQLIELGPQPGPDTFYNGGAGAGTWDVELTTNWRTTNTPDVAPSDTEFFANDKANFGDLGPDGARTVTVAAGGVDAGAVIVNNTGTNSYTIGGGPIRGATAALVKDGDAPLTLTGLNEFGGGTTIKHGTVNVSTIGDSTTAGNLGKGGSLTVGDATGAANAVLNYSGVTASAARSVAIGALGGNITVQTGGTTLTLTGNLTGTGPLLKGGSGNLAVTGTGGNFSGAITVPVGGLTVGGMASGAGAISVGTTGPASFTYGGSNLVDGRSLTVGASGATVGASDPNAFYRINGTITATAGALTVSGPGRLALGGVANFATMPTISAGATLALQNESGNVLPAAAISIPTGTLELAPGALGNNTAALTLSGGTLRLGHEGLLGDYYNGGVNNADLSGTAASVRNYFAGLGAPAVSARTNTAGQSNLDFNNGNGGNAAPFLSQGFTPENDLRSLFTGKILITSPGDTTFFTTSDDGSAVFIDGARVVNNNFFQGMTERSGTINLTAGLHDIAIYYYEGGGGAGFVARYQPAGGTKQIIPNGVLFAGDTYTDTARPILVTQSSALEIGSAVANLGALTQTGGTTLAVTGSAKFSGTTLSGAGALGLNNRIGNVNLGPITATSPTINKSGDGALVFSQATPANTTINASAGLVVVQGSEAGGTTTNPLSAATVNFSGTGNLGLSATAGNPTYNIPVSSAGSYRIEAGQFGGGNIADTTVTLQNAGLVVTAGSTLTTRGTDSNFTLNVNAPISGAGSLTAEEGNINFTGGSVNPQGGFTVNVARVNVSGPLTTGALTVANSLNGVVPNGANNTAQLTLGGAADVSSLTVNGGSFTTNSTLSNSGALVTTGGTSTLNGNATSASVNITNSTLTANGTFTSAGAFNVGGGGNATLNGASNLGSIELTGNAVLTATAAVTAGSVSVTPGTTLNLSTLNYTGSGVNVDEGLVRVQSGVVNMGTAPLTFASYTVQAGLLEGVITGTNDLNAGSPGLTTPNPGTGKGPETGGARLSPRLGETNTKSATLWGDNETWVYTGQFFDADGTFTFGENIDDDTRLFIDGNLVLNSGCCGEARSSNGGANNGNNYGMGGAGDGWHRFELRMRNGGGGAGSDPTGNGWGQGDSAQFLRKGFGLNVAGTTSVAAADYVIPTDPGNATLFRISDGGGRVVIDAGSTLRVGSTTNSALVQLNGSFNNPAVLRINDNAAATVNTANAIAIPTGSSEGVVTVGTNNTLTVGKFDLSDGSTLTKNGPGTVRVTGTVAESVLGPAPTAFSTGNINVTEGTLLFDATSTGTGGITASVSGTVGGTGTLSGALTATSGGIVSPGNSVGVMNVGSLLMGTGSILKLEVTSADSHDVLNVGNAVNIAGSSLQLTPLNYVGLLNEIYYVIVNNSPNAVTGTFAGLPDGSTFTAGTRQFQISYDANSATRSFDAGGNDIAIRAVPEPGSLVTLLSGLGMLAGLQRIRRRR